MSKQLQARCGIDCGECKYKEQMNCSGCMKQDGKMFWGECEVAKCSMDKGHEHCGHCADFVCQTLHEFAYDPKEGDDGKRIENLKRRMAKEL